MVTSQDLSVVSSYVDQVIVTVTESSNINAINTTLKEYKACTRALTNQNLSVGLQLGSW